MDDNGELVLNSDCLLEIMNYVISDCNLKNQNVEKGTLRYDDLINFVLSHEFIVELLAVHHKRLYQDLEFALVCRIIKLLIDLRINKLSNQQSECFWKSYLQSVRERNAFKVELFFDHHKNKKDEPYVNITITGKSSQLWYFKNYICKPARGLKII